MKPSNYMLPCVADSISGTSGQAPVWREYRRRHWKCGRSLWLEAPGRTIPMQPVPADYGGDAEADPLAVLACGSLSGVPPLQIVSLNRTLRRPSDMGSPGCAIRWRTESFSPQESLWRAVGDTSSPYLPGACTVSDNGPNCQPAIRVLRFRSPLLSEAEAPARQGTSRTKVAYTVRLSLAWSGHN
jgi:hypothetical protein